MKKIKYFVRYLLFNIPSSLGERQYTVRILKKEVMFSAPLLKGTCRTKLSNQASSSSLLTFSKPVDVHSPRSPLAFPAFIGWTIAVIFLVCQTTSETFSTMFDSKHLVKTKRRLFNDFSREKMLFQTKYPP